MSYIARRETRKEIKMEKNYCKYVVRPMGYNKGMADEEYFACNCEEVAEMFFNKHNNCDYIIVAQLLLEII